MIMITMLSRRVSSFQVVQNNTKRSFTLLHHHSMRFTSFLHLYINEDIGSGGFTVIIVCGWRDDISIKLREALPRQLDLHIFKDVGSLRQAR